MTALEAFTRTLPILLLILLGVGIRRVRLIRPESVAEIKTLIVNLTLPLLLFRAFATMQAEVRFLALVASVFLLNVVVLVVSGWVGRRAGASPYFPALMTGFEAGMVGYAIFGAVYGQENIPIFAVFDLGQVLFVFFIMINTLDPARRGNPPLKQLGVFLRTPVIIGILTGILLNLTGLYRLAQAGAFSGALVETIGLVAGLTTPLVAITLGYELRLQPAGLPRALATALVRLATWVLLGIALSYFIVDGLLHLDSIFQAAALILFILPAPFIIPLYLRGASAEENESIVNTLSISTLLTLAAVVVVRILV